MPHDKNAFNEFIDTMFRPIEKRFDQPRRRKRPEAQVQKQIAGWLMLHGIVVAVTDAGIAHRLGANFSIGVPAGWPDLTACLKTGRFLGVECKAPRGRQREAQVVMQQKIEANNGIYIMATSLAYFIEELKLHDLDFPG